MGEDTRWWRRVPLDFVALLVIAFVVVASHVNAVRLNVTFGEKSWLFQIGARVLGGELPYRDVAFSGGPLPAFVDGAAQAVLGAGYRASLYAALLLKVLRVLAVWMLARRIAGWRAAVLLAAFCTVDPLFAVANHSDAAYVHVALLLAALGLLLAAGARARMATGCLAGSGFALSLVLCARSQAAPVVVILLAACTAGMLMRRDLLDPRRATAVWAGFVGGLALVLVVLTAVGASAAFVDTFGAMLVESAGDEILAAIGGFAFVHPYLGPWTGFLLLLVLPGSIVAIATYVGSRRQDVALSTIALILIPAGCLSALFVRYSQLDLLTDLPRIFLITIAALALLAPDRLRDWFGLEPVHAIAFGALPIISGEAPVLVVGVILCALSSSTLTARAKTSLCAALALAGVVQITVALHDGRSAVAATTSSPRGPTVSSRLDGLRGIRLSRAQKHALDWLAKNVEPGNTCFVAGNLPALYTLLGCENPTRVDALALVSRSERAEAYMRLYATPPQYLLVQDLSPELFAALPHYEPYGGVADAVGGELAGQLAAHGDGLERVRVFRRRAEGMR